MNIVSVPDGNKFVTFKTQHNTEGQVCLGKIDDVEATRLVKEMRVKELETVSGIVDLTHQVVTQIIAGKNVTVSDALLLWEKHVNGVNLLSPTTVRTNKTLINEWIVKAGIADRPITSITAIDISQYVNQGGERRTTSIRKLAALRSLFGFCLDNGLCVRNPASASVVRVTFDTFTHSEKEHIEKQTFTSDEIDKLLQVSDSDFWTVAILLGYETGLRLGDIAKLEWASIKEHEIIVWTDKANKRVQVPISSRVNQAIACIRATDISYCFPEQREIILDLPRRALLSMQFRRLCEKAGIDKKSFHCLRHTNATKLVQDGENLERVASRLGHSSTETTKGYVHVRPHFA